ncbi:MAG: hypothetical protein ACI85U_002911, partial [Candidatus Promineifilaceae bacterium]
VRRLEFTQFSKLVRPLIGIHQLFLKQNSGYLSIVAVL